MLSERVKFLRRLLQATPPSYLRLVLLKHVRVQVQLIQGRDKITTYADDDDDDDVLTLAHFLEI